MTGTRLKLSDDKKKMYAQATTRKALQRECNRLSSQVGWELESSEIVEGAEYPYKAVLGRDYE